MVECRVLRLFLLLGALSVCSALPGFDGGKIRVDASTHHFIDGDGRVRIFHGTNRVEKGAPFFPDVSDQELDTMQAMGINVIRLGVMWIGAEPERGQYSEDYFQAMDEVIAKYESRGIYLLLDVHQDVMNKKFCGEGFPDWAAQPDPKAMKFPLPAAQDEFPYDDQGYPQCSGHYWGTYYGSELTMSAFQNLYRNHNGLRDDFGRYWQKIASRYGDRVSVMGYDLLNEPWTGNYVQDPRYIIQPGFGDRENLEPFFRAVAQSIREVDNSTVAMYEPVTWDYTPVGFQDTPEGPEYDDRSAMSWHNYCLGLKGRMEPKDWTECTLTHDLIFLQRRRDIKRLGGGGMLTEWGALDQSNPTMVEELYKILDITDMWSISWAYWAWSGSGYVDQDGKLTDQAMHLARPYATAIAGNPTWTRFDKNRLIYELKYDVNHDCTLPTEIFLSLELYYKGGVDIDVQPASEVKLVHKDGFLNISHSDKVDTVSVTLKPKNL